MTQAAATGARGRLPELSLRTFRLTAYAALLALFLVTVSGATVRLTGSGLGCENWPRCGETFLPEQGYHAYVEFGNRVVGFLVGLTTLAAAFAAWRARIRGRLLAGVLGLPLLVLAQGVLGGITVIFELHPLIVMGHFLLSLAAVGLAVWVVVAAEQLVRRADRPARPAWVSWLVLALVPAALALVVSGAFVTAAGPHSGGENIERLGNLENAMYVHVRVAAVFGVGFLALVAALLRGRTVRGDGALALVVFALLVVQMVVGETQWRHQLPWWLVLAHVALATAVWAGVVALAAQLSPRSSPIAARSAIHPRESPG